MENEKLHCIGGEFSYYWREQMPHDPNFKSLKGKGVGLFEIAARQNGQQSVGNR